MSVKKRIMLFLALFAFVFTLGGEVLLSAFSITASAETASFDARSIETDLEEIGVDETVYQKNPNGEVSLIHIMEYCFSDYRDLDSLYTLYFYVYNPTGEPIDVKYDKNSINMCIDYDDVGEPSSYGNVDLTYLDSTSDHLFYKFKLTDSSDLLELEKFYSYTFSNGRRYDFIGIQVKHENKTIAKEYEISKTYFWRGYSKGCGAHVNAKDTLTCEYTGTDTINLEIFHTTWRNGVYDDDYTTTAITTAYFGVPERYFDDYIGINAIKASWEKYTTQPIFVTSSKARYDEIIKYVGLNVGQGNNELTARILWERTEAGKPAPGTGVYAEWDEYYKVYNAFKKEEDGSYIFMDADFWQATIGNDYKFADDGEWLPTIYYLLYVEAGDDPTLDDYFVSSEELENYMRWYTANKGIEVTSQEFSIDLFSGDGESVGITINAESKVIDIDAERDWLWQQIFGNKTQELEYDTIVILDESIRDMTESDFESTYLVDNDTVGGNSSGTVYGDCIKMLDAGMRPVLLKFAESEYYCSPAYFDNTDYFHTGEGSSEVTSCNGYVAQEEIYLDFDVISMTFLNEDGLTETVIPVVADPTHVIGGLTANPDVLDEDDDWIRLLIGLVCLLLILTALQIIFPAIGTVYKVVFDIFYFVIKWIIKLLLLPFRLVGRLLSG